MAKHGLLTSNWFPQHDFEMHVKAHSRSMKVVLLTSSGVTSYRCLIVITAKKWQCFHDIQCQKERNDLEIFVSDLSKGYHFLAWVLFYISALL